MRAAVRESEEKAEERIKSVHDAYEAAATEQQEQIKNLLREAEVRARQKQEQAVAEAVAVAKEQAEDEARVSIEHARAAMQVCPCHLLCHRLHTSLSI